MVLDIHNMKSYHVKSARAGFNYKRDTSRDFRHPIPVKRCSHVTFDSIGFSLNGGLGHLTNLFT